MKKEIVFSVVATFVCIGYTQAIITPCALNDYACVRYVLAENSYCDPNVWGSVPSQVRFNDVEFQAPNFNITLLDQYTVVNGLDTCNISAFFFNPDRNRAVLAITCYDLSVEAHRQVIQHYPLEEDQYYFYRFTGKYSPIILTADFPHSDHITMCRTYIFPYITSLPQVQWRGQNPASRKFIADRSTMGDQLGIFEKEVWSQRAGSFYQLWVNNVLCNFNNYCTD